MESWRLLVRRSPIDALHPPDAKKPVLPYLTKVKVPTLLTHENSKVAEVCDYLTPNLKIPRCSCAFNIFRPLHPKTTITRPILRHYTPCPLRAHSLAPLTSLRNCHRVFLKARSDSPRHYCVYLAALNDARLQSIIVQRLEQRFDSTDDNLPG